MLSLVVTLLLILLDKTNVLIDAKPKLTNNGLKYVSLAGLPSNESLFVFSLVTDHYPPGYLWWENSLFGSFLDEEGRK